MHVVDSAGKWADPDASGATYVEHLASRNVSVGTYSLRSGSRDGQRPHSEDDIYVVMTGQSRFTSGTQTISVSPGMVLFVPAFEPHHFHDITEDLTLLVFFGPAEGTRARD